VTGPLDGVRVLDLTKGMPGAVTTMLLADHGAEVVSVARPGPPSRLDEACRTWNRGKASIVLDLDLDDDRAVARRLAAEADVVVEAMRPLFLESVGLGAEAVRASNPDVVYCRIRAFADLGDGAVDPSGYAALAAARYGVMAESGGQRDGPIFPGHPAIEYGTALVAGIGILAALRARIVTGEGDLVDVSMADGVLAQMGMNWSSERGLSFIASKSRTGALDMGHLRMLLRRYTCADGRLVQVHTGAAGAFGRAMELFGLADDISNVDAAVETSTLLTDHDLDVLGERLPEIFHTRPADEWLHACWTHEVACLPVQPPGVVFDDEQIRFAGIMRHLEDPHLGSVDVVGPVISLSASPGHVRGPAPERDADGARLRGAGWAAQGLPARDTPNTLEHPLDGIRIVELSIWFASPYGNRLLADLGADVVKVETLHGDTIRPLPDPCEGANRGKRSLAVDLKTEDGSAILDRLLASADVVQHNMRPGAAERLGIDVATLRGTHPDVVYAYAPGYGSRGPKSRLQSFAPLLSGFVGLMHLSAGEGNGPHTGFGNEDYYNGLLSATSILLALVHRERTGRAQYVESPQLHSSVLVTSEWYRRDGELCSTLPTLDHDQTGWGPFYRLYQCLEGWLCVAAVRDAEADALLATVLPDGVDREAPDVAERLTDALFGDTAAAWTERLRSAGVPCEVVREDSWLRAVLHDDRFVAAGRVNEIEHPLHGRARVIGQLFHLDSHPGIRRGRSPLLGEHTDELLVELGYSADDRATLFDSGVVAAQTPPR
jgi:crotonobetainyl-CoA:carnitine CoA-transferase CaiB-like acyl-CoA transferase